MDKFSAIIIIILCTVFFHFIGYCYYFRNFENKKLYCIIGDVIVAVVGILAFFVFN